MTKLNILKGCSIFSLFLIFGFALFSIAAPIIASNASDSNTKVSTEVKPVIAIAAEPEANFGNITPTNNGTFASKPVETLVGTNAIKGFELYFSSKDEATDMINTNTSISDVVSSTFTGSVTESTMPKNAWGYSLNNTDFNPIPKKSEQKQIKNITTLPTDQELKTIVHFGTKISTNLTAGDYEKSVIFTAVAHANPVRPLHGISKMQEMTTATCDITTTPKKESTQLDTDGTHHGDPNYVPTKTLTDTRDNNTYTVSKLADGKCWMTQNLRIAGKTITSADSDVVNSYTIPSSSMSGFNGFNVSNAYIDSIYGGYYNFHAVTAGLGTYAMSTQGQNITSSICPKSWRLPTSYSSDSDFLTLYNTYNSSALLRADPVNLTLAGLLHNGAFVVRDNTGFYASSTIFNQNDSYTLTLGNTEVNPALEHSYKMNGFSARCIAR